jgi:hypothetical protein
MLDKFRARFLTPSLPYEQDKHAPEGRGILAVCAALVALSILEILAFAVGGVFSQVAAYLWFALGAFAFSYLCWQYLVAVAADLRRGALWGLIPLVVAVPFCFWYIDSYAFLNTESLSELHDTYAQMKKADLAYTSVFWTSYPSRSITLNLIPTAIFGISPWAYRAGFSFPILFGALFLFAGIRRFHIKERHASAVASLAATALFSYPMFCEISRFFEMAISSTSYGLWAIGAVFLFAARPTVSSALTAAWTIGLLASSFTSGLALVVLLWLLLGLWLARALIRRDKDVAALVSAILLNSIVVGVAMYLIRPRALRSKQIPFDQMFASFQEALGYTLSFSKPVFTPAELVVPTVIAALFALSLRGGLVPLILTGWCFPVIWSAANLHGKIGPQLPFALYRSLIIIPAILYVMSRCLLWLLKPLDRKPWIGRCCILALAVGLYWPLMTTYKTQPILHPSRAPEGREAVAMEIINAIPSLGLTPYSDAWIANRADEKAIENFLPCLQYFLPNWQRVHNSQPLPLASTDTKKPGLIITLPNDPSIAQEYPGYRKQNRELSVKVSHTQNVVLAIVALQPLSGW